MSFFIKKRSKLLRLSDNKVIAHNFLKVTDDLVKTRNEAFKLNPNNTFIDDEGIRYFFTNKNEMETFNPSTTKDELNDNVRKVKNYSEFYNQLLKTARYTDNEKMEEGFKTIRTTIYDFEPERPIESDNVNPTPYALKQIMDNEIASRLAKPSTISKLFILSIIGCGVMIGMVVGMYLDNGTFYDQRKYTQTDNYPYTNDTTNETIYLSIGVGSNSFIDYEEINGFEWIGLFALMCSIYIFIDLTLGVVNNGQKEYNRRRFNNSESGKPITERTGLDKT